MKSYLRKKYYSAKNFVFRLLDVETVDVDGLRFKLNSPLVPDFVRKQLVKGNYESSERRFLEDAIRRGDRVLELGCGMGFISLFATRLAGQGQVVSVEANPCLEPLIKENYSLNGWEPDLMLAAVQEQDGVITFEADPNLLSSSVAHRPGEGRRIIEIPAVAFDGLVCRVNPQVLLVDIEGTEIDIFKKSSDLSSVRAIVIEAHPHIVGSDLIDDMFEILHEHGFVKRGQSGKVYLLSR